MPDVLAPLVGTARTTRLDLTAGLGRARFDFPRQNSRAVEHQCGASLQEALERLGEVATQTSTPSAPLASRLVEEVVHGEGIRSPSS